MTIRAAHSWTLRLAVGALLLASPALAQDDDSPYDYPDDERDSRPRQRDTEDSPYAYPDDEKEAPRPSRRRTARPARDTEDDFRRAEQQDEEEERDFKRLAGLDDPNTGVAFEFIGGALFVSSARGQLLGLAARGAPRAGDHLGDPVAGPVGLAHRSSPRAAPVLWVSTGPPASARAGPRSTSPTPVPTA